MFGTHFDRYILVVKVHNLFVRMAKKVVNGDLSVEKFHDSYSAWKNHISHGNCYNLSKAMDNKIQNILNKRKTTAQDEQS